MGRREKGVLGRKLESWVTVASLHMRGLYPRQIRSVNAQVPHGV